MYSTMSLLYEGPVQARRSRQQFLNTPDAAAKTLKLKAFQKFENTTDAMSAVTALAEGKVSKRLKKFLPDELSELDLKDKLVVGDSKLDEDHFLTMSKKMKTRTPLG
ncbi:UNVERIFIED_CONTAM: hypothetical protein HDU68_004536, partial [Siphonaria sp. JEL0065]